MFNLTENDLSITRIKFCQEVPSICNRSYNVPSEFEIPSTASEKFEELEYLHTEDTELLNAVPNTNQSENGSLNDGKLMKTKSPEDCWMICRLTLGCEGFTWTDSYTFPKNVRNSCLLKKSLNEKRTMSDDPHTISGLRNWY